MKASLRKNLNCNLKYFAREGDLSDVPKYPAQNTLLKVLAFTYRRQDLMLTWQQEQEFHFYFSCFAWIKSCWMKIPSLWHRHSLFRLQRVLPSYSWILSCLSLVFLVLLLFRREPILCFELRTREETSSSFCYEDTLNESWETERCTHSHRQNSDHGKTFVLRSERCWRKKKLNSQKRDNCCLTKRSFEEEELKQERDTRLHFLRYSSCSGVVSVISGTQRSDLNLRVIAP